MINVNEYNKSTIYLLPIAIPNIKFSYIRKYFVGTYLKGIDNTIPNSLALVLKYEDDEIFDKYEALIEKSPFYRFTINPNAEHIAFIFELPIDVYYLFEQGLYSKLQPQDKVRILDFFNMTNISDKNYLWLILNKHNAYRHILMKNLGCTKAKCTCEVRLHEEPIYVNNRIVDLDYHVDRNPAYKDCKHYKSPTNISPDAELDDIYDIEKETYETADQGQVR